MIKLTQPIDKILGSAHRKRWNEHIAFVLHRLIQYLFEFLQSIRQRPMIAVTIGRLQHQHIGVFKAFRVPQQR